MDAICKAALCLVFDLHQSDCHAEIMFADCGLLPVSALISAAKLCWKVRLSNMSAERFPVATQEQRDTTRLRSSSGRPTGFFLTAIPGGCMTLSNDMFVVSVWHRPGHHVLADEAPPPCKSCKCSAGVAAEADHAMVCEKVANMTQMRHDGERLQVEPGRLCLQLPIGGGASLPSQTGHG